MGGNGSTRWQAGYQRKRQVDECWRLNVRQFDHLLRALETSVDFSIQNHIHQWTCADRTYGSVRLQFNGESSGIDAWIFYTGASLNQDGQNLAYAIGMRWSRLFRTGRKWWWVCPGCGRNCRFLYLPPGERRFACRKCHRLAYDSQNRESWRAWMKKHLPPRDPPGAMSPALQAYLERLREESLREPHPAYLTEEEILQRSGLSAEDLQALNAARLLVPDTQEGLYRPKLAGMLAEGRSVEEIKRWSKKRWQSSHSRRKIPR